MPKAEIVKVRGVEVRIYQTRNKGHRQFSVSYHTPSGRKLRQFRDKKDAQEFAKKTANELAQGKADAAGAFTFRGPGGADGSQKGPPTAQNGGCKGR